MKKIIFALSLNFLFFSIFSQEVLKSVEEDYFDFLSLVGTVKKPTLGYRTLSDSSWIFTDQEDDEVYEETLDDDEEYVADQNTPTKKSTKPKINPWKNNNLGQKKNLYGNPNVFLKVYGPQWYSSINSETPYGQNDGALWQGRGYNTSISAGFRLEAYFLELTFRPLITYSQNLEFETMGGVYNYSWIKDADLYRKQLLLAAEPVTNPATGEMVMNSLVKYFYDLNAPNRASGNIDLVQRYGDSYVRAFDWGDTEIRLTWKNITAGLGTQSPWLGPAVLNPMLGSNNAATYPKIDFGLRRTQIRLPFLHWYLGDIEGRIWTGYLTESDYFDTNTSNNHTMLNGLSVSFSPSVIPGLTIGANRIFLTAWKISNLKYLGRLFTFSESNEKEDQKASLFAEWNFQKIGFRIYGELGIDDFTSDKESNPFHTGIYTVGLKQYIPLPFNKLFPKAMPNAKLHSELCFEWNNFEMSQDFQLQFPYLGYYSHSDISQGYTNKGQILGAGTGYFGNSQYISYKVYYPKGSTTLFFHRSCPNNNWVYSQAVYSTASGINPNNLVYANYYAQFETYFDFGIKTNFFATKSLNIEAGFDWVDIYHWRYYFAREKRNLQFSLNVKYNI